MEEASRCDDPSAVHRGNIFKCEVIEKPNYYKNHFSLMEEKQELLETLLNVTILRCTPNFVAFITGNKIS